MIRSLGSTGVPSGAGAARVRTAGIISGPASAAVTAPLISLRRETVGVSFAFINVLQTWIGKPHRLALS